jgi:hypothetical protein
MNFKKVGALFFLLFSACGLTIERFEDIRREAAACTEGDSCVSAGSGACTCSAPVNASKAAFIVEAAKSVDCRGRAVDCAPALQNLRCESGRCVGDLLASE